MKQGFTLVELLAVVVILAIIAIITTPIIIGVVSSSKENAFKDSADGVSKAARSYQLNNNDGKETTFNFESAVATPVLKTKGELPDYGTLTIDENGKISYALWSDEIKKCLVKTNKDKVGKISTTIKTKEDCKKTTIRDTAGPTITEVYTGGMVYKDPNFSLGNNSIVVYNNTGNGMVTHSRIPLDTGYGGYALQITTSGAATPGLGGFYFATMTAPNKIMTTKIIAKIPKGYSIAWASNAIGTGGTSGWLTPTAGTGEWEEYIYRVTSGTASFSSTNFYYLNGVAGTTAKPVTWQVAYATVYSNVDNYSKASVTFKATDTDKIAGYGINQSNTIEPAYTSTSSTSVSGVLENITENGTYYIWVKDAAGNTTTKAVNVTNVS